MVLFEEEELFTIAQTAERLRLEELAVWELIGGGLVRSIVFVKSSSIEEYLRSIERRKE